MSTRYFKIANATKEVETEEFKFKFEPTYRFLGSIVGTIAIEDAVQSDALSEVAAVNGVEELSEAEYANALQKKRSLSVNIVRHHSTVTSKAGVAPVEAKSDGETSSDVDSVEDLLTTPDPVKETAPTPEPAKPAPKKRRTRKPKKTTK